MDWFDGLGLVVIWDDECGFDGAADDVDEVVPAVGVHVGVRNHGHEAGQDDGGSGSHLRCESISGTGKPRQEE